MQQHPSYESVFRASPNAYLLLDAQLVVTEVNDAYLALTGFAPGDLPGQHLGDVFAMAPGGDVAALLDSCMRVLACKVTDTLPITRFATSSSSARMDQGDEESHYSVTHTPILDEHCSIVAILQCLRATPALDGGQAVRSIGESTPAAAHGDALRRYRKHLEELVGAKSEALSRSEAQRRATEAALLQAQKLEAVGKLTGGIAHDFNNMLQIIGGNLQLLRRSLGDDQAALRRLDSAVGGVEKGARLASQLLAFASRQPLRPQSIRLGQFLEQMHELLDGALGAGVRVELDTAEALWPVLVDVGNLQGVILNLVANARDAMNGSGRLLLRLRNRTLQATQPMAGDYVQLSVIDEGAGMTREVSDRAFEPFFTTKQASNASGLGLSMVYGFVKQSGGFVTLDSEAGSGTAVHVYLPRSTVADALTEVVSEGARPQRVEQRAQTLKVLFVEDDPTLRMLTGEVIAELGHEVTLSESAEEALEQLGAHPFDVLLTDVGLAGMSGIELARQARQRHPELALVIASGYAVDAREEGIESLRVMLKPYDIHQVRELLETIADERRRAHGAG